MSKLMFVSFCLPCFAVIELLELFEKDPGTSAILMIGEIGGTAEEKAAEYIAKSVKKPVAAFIAGQTAPPGRRMGHAGAIISGGSGSAADKIAALKAAKIEVAPTPADLGSAVQEAIRKVSQQVKLPTGYHIDWAGEFESQQRSQRRLAVIVPITIVVILFILYSALDSFKWAALILLNVAIAPIGTRAWSLGSSRRAENWELHSVRLCGSRRNDRWSPGRAAVATKAPHGPLWASWPSAGPGR